jgi:hypothetical protein
MKGAWGQREFFLAGHEVEQRRHLGRHRQDNRVAAAQRQAQKYAVPFPLPCAKPRAGRNGRGSRIVYMGEGIRPATVALPLNRSAGDHAQENGATA